LRHRERADDRRVSSFSRERANGGNDRLAMRQAVEVATGGARRAPELAPKRVHQVCRLSGKRCSSDRRDFRRRLGARICRAGAEPRWPRRRFYV
jgi:hypothetical protein